MLGRLLQTAASTFQQNAKPPIALESITEESHTRELLFPDIYPLNVSHHSNLQFVHGKALATPKDAASCDGRGGLDITCPGDIRVVIAQDACGQYQAPQILYDSQHSISRSTSPLQDTKPSRNQILTARGKSMTTPSPSVDKRRQTPNASIFSSFNVTSASSTPRSPEPKSRGLFGEPRPSHHSPSNSASEDIEAIYGLSKDEKEETEAMLVCMFGATGSSLEHATKLHVISRRVSHPTTGGASVPQSPRPVSSGGFPRRRTPLIRSTSAAEFTGDSSTTNAVPGHCTMSTPKPSIMLTRLFSLTLPDSISTETMEAANGMERASATSRNLNVDKCRPADEPKFSKSVKQTKVPMYAIAIILSLPEEVGSGRARGQATGQEFLPYVPGTAPTNTEPSHRIEQHLLQYLPDMHANPIFDAQLKIHVSYVLGHWAVLGRSMEILEDSARSKLLELLNAIPLPPLMSTPPVKLGNNKSKKEKQPTQQTVHVPSECLQEDASIKHEVDIASRTIVSGLRIRRVVIGQGRWGAWREEARWVRRWAGNREENFFFFNLLTAFLGNHNAWLRSLESSHYHRQNSVRNRPRQSNNNRMKHRTVIVANNKMAARRLIFLLANFFPGSPNSSSGLPPSIGHHGGTCGEQSPTSSLGREQSLRRTAARSNASAKASGFGVMHNRSVSFSVVEQDRNKSVNGMAAAQAHERRGSDARSIRTPSLAIPSKARGSRKASISTVVADSDLPVPHFSAVETLPKGDHNRQSSSGGSLASVALSQTLRRTESTNASTSGGKWGSVVSGFWSHGKDSSTYGSEVMVSPPVSPSNKQRSPEDEQQKLNKLAQMVEEVTAVGQNGEPKTNILVSKSPRQPSATEDYVVKKPSKDNSSAARTIPVSKPERLPLKLSYNEEEGYLDVSLSPSYSLQSSLASSFASMRLSGHVTGSSHDHQSPQGSFTSDSSRQNAEPAIHVAGWLKAYHPNFTLQAVRSYSELLDEIKSSMCEDARISLPHDLEIDLEPGKWTDVCVTLVAETTSFTIQRLRLCRRRKPEITGLPDCKEGGYEEKFFAEVVMDMDATLTDAIERVLSQSGGSSRTQSRAHSPKPSSRPSSIHRKASTTVFDQGGTFGEAPYSECRKILLGALEEVVRSVAEEYRDEGRAGNVAPIRSREADSTLREGIRKWLAGVEDWL